MSTLYLVATPIGNLEDLSPRAIRILKEVTLIACEDTRHTGKLLTHFEIKNSTTSYYDHNKKNKLQKILAALNKGDVALVSDAGAPGLNDPGYLLVNAAIEAGHNVSPIPGPSAPIAALVSSGLSTDRFLYLGYLPRKSNGRIKALEEIKHLPYTLIFFETPHRLDDALIDIENVLGNRNIAIASELTKLYENIYRGSITQAKEHFIKYPARGEYTLILEGNINKKAKWTNEELLSKLEIELQTKISASNLAKNIAKISGWSRSDVYDQITKLQNK